MHRDSGPRHVHRRFAAAAIAVACAVSLSAPARADLRSAAPPDGWGKVISYFSCTYAIVMAGEPAGWVAASVACLKTLRDELV